MPPRILKLVSHFAVYAIGTVVLLASVLVTAVRIVLPDIGIYRGEVEAWVSNYMGYPVAIRSMDASWQGWVPNLQLTNIDLLNQAGTRTITHFAAANITVDPIATLLARRIVPRQLVISGFDISIVRMENGALIVQGINLGTAPGAQTGRSELADWLFRQERIRIEKGTIQWTDRLHGQQPVLLGNVALSLRSDGKRLQAEGSAALPPVYGKSMDFAFDARGDLLTADWSGDFYLAASDINPDNWYRNYRPHDVDIAGGSADIRLWSSWSGARLASVQGLVTYRDFVTHVGAAALRVDLLDGGFRAATSGAGRWDLSLKLNRLETEHGTWPASSFSLEVEPGGAAGRHYVASFGYLKLEDVAPLVAAGTGGAAKGENSWRGISARGELLQGTVAFGQGRFMYNLGFRGLALGGLASLPGIRSASGRMRGDLDHARLDFDRDAVTLVLPGVTRAEMPLSGLDGSLEWRRSDSGWTLRSSSLHLDSPDVSAHVAGTVTQVIGDPRGLFMDVTARAGALDAPVAVRYLPLRGDSRLRQWLDRAVVSGRVLSADLVLRGHLGEFPFREREGRFAAIVTAEDVTLDYSDKWPPIDNLGATLEFDGPSMVLEAAGGQIFSAQIGNATARIPDIRAAEKRLDIAGTVRGRTADLGLFIEQSPLAADPILTRVRESVSGGDMDLRLDLSLPLGPGTPATVTGTLDLAGAQMRTGFAQPPLQRVTGRMDFTRSSASGSGIQARFHGQPVTISVFGDRALPDEPPRIVVSGSGDDEFIRARIEDFLPGLTTGRPALFNRLQGSTDWDVAMTFVDVDGDGRPERRISVQSDLTGLAVDLPRPLGKPADTAVTFRLARNLDLASPADIELRYGGQLAAAFTPRTDAMRAPAVAVEFGDPEILPHSDEGIRVRGTVAELPVTGWWDVVRDLRDPADGQQSRADVAAAVDARVHVRNLQLVGQQFHDVEVAGSRATDGWTFRLRGAEIEGDVTIPGRGMDTAPLRAELARLKIARAEGDRTADAGTDAEDQLDPRRIPPLQVNVADLDFNGHALGAMKLATSRINDGMQMDVVEFSKPGLAIKGTGTWLWQDNRNRSQFDISVHADAIDDMLQTFGYNVAAVRKGKTELELNAAWDGAPSEFSWSKLTGKLHMQVRKGQLLDVEPKAGRLFGLLSFQSLPRRLSLDFTDLFGKGMAFDKIEGTFEIADGNAYTNDLHLRGPSAEVAVAGRTGLVVQDYDQIVTVTPQVTGSLPVAGALFGPVGIGIGAVLYLAGEVFGSASDGIGDLLRYQYTVTGSWADPVIEKIDGKDKG